MALTPGTRLGPYEVAAKVGAGGMGEVYRARDAKLNRDVALKVLLPEVATTPELLARFRREAQILASLNHPNIAQIYGLEDAGGGATALVLELVEGRTLADRIDDGPLALDEALPIGVQVAAGLAAAHGRGIVHRDLKPANIKVRSDGTVKLLDFGLARAVVTNPPAHGVTDVSTATGLGRTNPGAVMGTVPYMSPEQTRGMPLDHRTDIWAFGCVFYEMLAGKRAFSGHTTSDVIAAVLGTDPDWSVLPISRQSRLGKLLRHCLEKRPQSRLDDITAAKAVFDYGLARYRRRNATGDDFGRLVAPRPTRSRTFLRPDPETVPSAPPAPLLVLVADTANSTGQEIFDKTLTSIAKGALERSSFITVLRPDHLTATSDSPLTESAALLLAVRQRASVVLSSAVVPADDRYRIAFAATQALTGAVVCSVDAVCSVDDAVRTANRLLQQVRRELGDSSSDTSVLFAQLDLSTTSLEAIRHHADALDASSRGSFQASFDSALKAVERDPKFGVGYLALAVASHNLGRAGAALAYLRTALQHLDGMTARERLATRGTFYQFTGEYRLGLREYEEMVRCCPGDPMGHNQLACCHEGLHQFAQAVVEIRKVVELLPNRPIFRVNLALYAALAGDFQTAEREAHAALDLGMEKWGLLVLGRAQFGQGRLTEAGDTFSRLERIDHTAGASAKAALAAYEGRFTEAIAMCASIARPLDGEAAERGWALSLLAYVHQLRGEQEAARDAAERAQEATDDPDVRLSAAIVSAQVGAADGARAVARLLAESPGDKSEAYAALVEGEILLNSGAAREAVKRFSAANGLIDTWFGHFGLGRAYLRSGLFVQADSEFDRCVRRSGELLLGNNIAYLPAAYLHQGHARQGLNNAGFADSFGIYLKLRGVPNEDPQLADVRHYLSRA